MSLGDFIEEHPIISFIMMLLLIVIITVTMIIVKSGTEQLMSWVNSTFN